MADRGATALQRNIPQRLAWTIAAISVLIMLPGIGLSIAHAVSSGEYAALISHQSLVPLSTLIYAILGALVGSRHPRNPIGWIFAAVGLLYGLNALSVGFSTNTASLPEPASQTVRAVAGWLDTWVWIPGTVLPLTFVYLLFPEGHLPSPRWRLVAWPAGLGIAATAVGVALHPGPLESWGASGPNPFGIQAAAGVLEMAANVGGGLLVIGLAGSLAAVGVRFRRSRGVEREQLKWLVYASGLMVVGVILAALVWVIWPEHPAAAELSIFIPGLANLGIAVASAIAILRYRLYDIDLIINRTLVYGALTACVAGLYGVIVGGAGVMFQTSADLASVLLTTLLVAVMLGSLRTNVQRGVDRLMLGTGPSRPKTATAAVKTAAPRSEPAESKSAVRPRLTLTAPWLAAMRLAWLVLVVLALALWMIGSIANATTIPAACPGGTCDPFAVAAGDLVALADLNLPVRFIAGFFVATNVAIALAFFAIGGAIAWRKSADWMGLLVSFTLVYLGAVFFTDSDDALWRTYAGARLPLALLGMAGYAALMALFFYFPDGRFVPGGRVAQMGGWLVILITAPFAGTATRVGAVGTVPLLATAGLGLAAQIYRYQRISGRTQRQQTKWIVLGLAASLAVMVLWVFAANVLPPGPPSQQRVYFLLVVRPLITILIPLLPISIAFSILRYRLWDVDVVINRALVYGALTAAIVALYALLVGGLGALFRSSGNLLVSLLATGLAAVLFQPLRERLQNGVNRLMYGERHDPYAVLSRLGRRLEATLAPEATLPAVVETVAQALKLPYVAIALHRDDELEIVTSYGLPVDDPLRLPLTYQSETIGQLILAPRAANEPFTAGEDRLLQDIAHQTSVAVHAVRLTDDLRRTAAELQRSREQLITAREEERRRLRRDLHDGLGPALAAQRLRTGSARALLASNPAAADALLAELDAGLATALADIRRLVYDLRPPVLDELGLVGAIRDSATRFNTRREAAGPAHTRPPRITIEAPERLPPLPAAAEVAAYRIVQEALTNVGRHAQAATCRIRLALDDRLRLTISDDGIGLPAGRRAGVGLISMRERAEELGGSCIVEPAPAGGTRVVVQLPLADAK